VTTTRPMARTALLLAVTALGLAACALQVMAQPVRRRRQVVRPSTSTSAPPAGTAAGTPADGRLSWHACDRQFRCASLSAPVSYTQPSGGTLQVSVVELPARDKPATAPDIVMNPGGPGASGVQFLEGSASSFPAVVLDHFNLVSFDPRGVGQSDP